MIIDQAVCCKYVIVFSSSVAHSQYSMIGDKCSVVILQGHCHGPQRSCRPAMCRDHFHLLPRSS